MALREQEANDDCWFILPPKEDDRVDWFNFSVEIVGPVSAAAATRARRGC